MKPILPDYQNSGVLIIGDVMLDRYWHGPTGRISPEAPVPVVKVENNEERPGGAANVAMNIASLGGHAHIVGLTGIDEPAKVLNETLSALKVKCDFVSIPNYPTITKLRVLSRGQQLLRLDFEDKFDEDVPRPKHWGGFMVIPDEFEFWQDGDFRLHDRFILKPTKIRNEWNHLKSAFI